MSKLLKQIAKEEEHDFTLATNDFFRADLKHIGNSIFEIRRHFIFEDDRTITPRNLENSSAKVKDCLLELVENHAFVLGLDTRTDKDVDNTNHPKTEPCFMFLSETLSVTLDFTTSPRPGNSVCDVFIVFPTKPTVVLSLVDGDEESREALAYNTSVARGVRHKLIRFMDEDVNSIHGVINTSTLKDHVAFKTRLKVLADDSSHFVPMRSLLMNPRRYDRVLTAFWAGVAETKSVLKENGEGDNCVRFLTKEQCIILVENINSKDVQVRCVPGSGATTLMLEVARRLSRLGDTLLVCRSRKEERRLRSAYASVVSMNDLSKLDLSPYVNIVDETNSVTPETRRHHWKFETYVTDIKQLKYRKWIVEREIDRMEKLMDALTNGNTRNHTNGKIVYINLYNLHVIDNDDDSADGVLLVEVWYLRFKHVPWVMLSHNKCASDQWSRRMKYLEGDFDVLILLSEKLRQNNIVFQQNKCSSENKPREPTRAKILIHPGPVVQEAELIAWQERVEQEKSVFPLLRSVMVKDRTNLIYQDIKLDHLKKASREGEEKMKDSTQSSEPKFWNQQNTARAFQESSDDAQDGWELQHTENVEALGHPEKIPETSAENKTGSSSTEKLNDIHTEERPELQDTDVGEAESHTQGTESLNEELGRLKSNRDHKTRQLDKLQTDGLTHVEWQNSINYLMRYPEDLSLFNVELPGLDSVSIEDQDESNLQKRTTHRQNTVFTKDSKQKEKLNDIHTEDRSELLQTDVGEAENRMQEIESLNEELGSLKSNRDHITRQLDKLQTDCWTHVEWQNSIDYLMRYPGVLSLFNVELPGLDSVSIEDQDESNLQKRTTHRQNTVFTKDSKQKFSGATSKLVVVEREAGYTAKDECHSPYRSTGLIHLLRRYQHGSLKERDLTTLTFEVMAEDEQRLADLTAKNASLEKDFGSTVHIVGAECRPEAISCPERHLDAARANTKVCHVTTDGELVNSRPDTRGKGRNKLHMYWGTCSSPIPLPPPPSALTPLPTTSTYWETQTRVRVVEGVSWYVLEMGVVEAGQVDSRYCVPPQRRYWSVSVGSCNRHGGSLCTRVCREGERGECHQNSMSRTPGTQVTLHYGMVLDVGRGRVAFIDLDRGIVLDKYDEVFREPLVPMFGVELPSDFTVSMSLISGEDVDMTDIKRALVYQALR